MVSSPQHRFDPATLKRTYPVADVIARYGIRLRPSGRALIGRCPFHVDRGRPNLYVYPESHSWYCYRCAIGGDVIEFVQRQEGIGFAAACERLAQLPPPATASPTTSVTSQPSESRRWDRLPLDEQVVMNTACAIYQHALWRTPRALAYLRERAIPDWVIRACGLGYADGHTLEAYLRRRFGLRLAQELGLLGTAARRDGGRPLREFLAGRIVVPELRGGRCIWFIGRQLDDRADRPKYLALSGERPVLGLERAAGANEVFLCEGVFDYLTAVSWRLPAWSPCGTHLPAERLGFVRRAKIVYGVLDGDAPGHAAAARFAEQFDARWRPLCLPDGCDLNDLGRQPGGRATFFRELNTVRRGARMEDPQTS